MRFFNLSLSSAFALLIVATPCFAESFSGRVVGIADGDTVTVLDKDFQQHKVRLSGIDAPEKSQAFGNLSKQHLASLVFGRPVTVQAYKTDRYGRTVGKVLVEGIDANLEQIRAGLAWHYKEYEREQETSDRKAYATAEERARLAQRGLWRESGALPPWEYRHQRRNR